MVSFKSEKAKPRRLTELVLQARHNLRDTPARNAVANRTPLRKQFKFKEIIDGNIRAAYGPVDIDWIVELQEDDKKYHYTTFGDLHQLLLGTAYQIIQPQEIKFKKSQLPEKSKFGILMQYQRAGIALSTDALANANEKEVTLLSRLYYHEQEQAKKTN